MTRIEIPVEQIAVGMTIPEWGEVTAVTATETDVIVSVSGAIDLDLTYEPGTTALVEQADDATVDVDGVWSETYYERSGRGYRIVKDGDEPCCCCGRLVKAGSGWDVRFIMGGPVAVRADLAAESIVGFTAGGDMGLWVLGSECAKRVPATHRVRRAA